MPTLTSFLRERGATVGDLLDTDRGMCLIESLGGDGRYDGGFFVHHIELDTTAWSDEPDGTVRNMKPIALYRPEWTVAEEGGFYGINLTRIDPPPAKSPPALDAESLKKMIRDNPTVYWSDALIDTVAPILTSLDARLARLEKEGE